MFFPAPVGEIEAKRVYCDGSENEGQEERGWEKEEDRRTSGTARTRGDHGRRHETILHESNTKPSKESLRVGTLNSALAVAFVHEVFLSRASRLQEECDRYSIAQQANYDRLETLKEIRLGSRAYLGREMDEINYKIKELNVQLKELDDLKEAERVDFNKQIHDLRTKDLQEMREKNESENHMLRSKLNSLDELKQKKESLLAEISRLDEELKQQEHDYREDIYHREKSAVLEKDK